MTVFPDDPLDQELRDAFAQSRFELANLEIQWQAVHLKHPQNADLAEAVHHLHHCLAALTELLNGNY